MHINTDQNLEIATTIDQPHTTIMKTGTDTVGLDHNPIITDTTAKVAMIPTEAIPGHTTGTTDDITGVVHTCLHSSTYTHHSHCDTPHCRSSSHRSSSAYSRDHSRSHS